MKRIAVLMTCYNRVDTTLECLRRLFAQEIPEGYSFDIWLVDDASPDKTGEKVKVVYPQVNVIQGTGKLFWCKGMRLAWDKAVEAYDYDFYLWLNDDAMLNNGVFKMSLIEIEELISKEDKHLAVLIGAFVDKDGYNEISYSAGDVNGKDVIPTGIAPIRAYRYFGGNYVFIPRNVFKKVGPICDLYLHGAGDFDYARMLERENIPFYVASKICGWCNKSDKTPIVLHKLRLKERLRLLATPTGYCLRDAFIFRYRHDNLVRAILSVVHVLVVVLCAKDRSKNKNKVIEGKNV